MKINHIILPLVLIFMIAFQSCQTINLDKSIQKTIHKIDTFQKASNPINKIWQQDQNLNALIDSVLFRNQYLKIEEQRVFVERLLFNQTALRMRPFASLQLNPSVRKFGKYTMDGVGNYDTQFSPNITPAMKIPTILPDFQLGLQTNWEIDVWGKLQALKSSQALRYLESEEGLKWYKTQLVAQTASYYGELVGLDQELIILKTNIEIQKKAVDLVKIQKEAGVVNEMAVLQLEAQLENTKSQEGAIKDQIIHIENEIRYLLNEKSGEIKRTLMPLDLDLSENYRKINLSFLYNRPDVKQAQMQLEAQLYQVKASEASLKPSLSISNFVGFQSFRPSSFLEIPGSIAYSLITNLTQPIFNKGYLKTDLKISESKLNSLKFNFIQTLNKAYLDWDSNVKGIEFLNQQIVFKSREVDLNVKSINTVSELFQTSKANYLEVLTAQQNILKAELDLLELYKKRWVSSVRLFRILGGN